MEDLAKLIHEDRDIIDVYLSETTTEQFIEDVKNLIKNSHEKEIIKQAIKKLQELI